MVWICCFLPINNPVASTYHYYSLFLSRNRGIQWLWDLLILSVASWRSVSISFNEVQSLLYKSEGFLSDLLWLSIVFSFSWNYRGMSEHVPVSSEGAPRLTVLWYEAQGRAWEENQSLYCSDVNSLSYFCCIHWTELSWFCGETLNKVQPDGYYQCQNSQALLPFALSYLHSFLNSPQGEKWDAKKKLGLVPKQLGFVSLWKYEGLLICLFSWEESEALGSQ